MDTRGRRLLTIRDAGTASDPSRAAPRETQKRQFGCTWHVHGIPKKRTDGFTFLQNSKCSSAHTSLLLRDRLTGEGMKGFERTRQG